MANEPTPAPAPSENITATPPAPAPAPTTNVTATPPAPATPPAAAPTMPALPVPSIAAPPAWLLKADFAILGLLLVFTFLLGSFSANNSDLWMQLAVGQRLSEGNFTFGTDPFSWLTEAKEPDQPAVFWVHQSWLYSWLLYQLYELVGGGGLVIIKALLFTIAVGLLSRIGWSESNRWFVLIALVMAALVASSRVHLQPVVVSFLFLSITLYVLNRTGFFGYARPDGKTPCPRILWALPPLFALWANLDAWFILGPIVVGVCWGAAGLTRWFPHAKVVPGKTLGLLFAASVLACLVNPYHVRVFQLPPELSYVVASVTDAIGLRLSSEVVGAGRTLTEMKKADSEFAWTLPTVSSKYWSEPRFGLNIAALAFVPLVLLGLLAFTLTARVKPQPDGPAGVGQPAVQAPAFHVGRFLLWLVFGVLALALHRMIPFFVLIAAPLTAMTLGEFLHWQQTVAAVPAERRDRGLKLARFVTVPFVLLLIYLAWPGWLHGANDFTSPRRVAWEVRADPSLQRAAETLQALKKDGKCKNVLAAAYDKKFTTSSQAVGDYLAWFAPDVKYGMDSRFALYADRLPAYAKARHALLNQEPGEWHTYFDSHQVDQVVVVNFVQRDGRFPAYWWLNADEWRQRGGDNRAVIFSWAGRAQRWPADDDGPWNKDAFGAVPKEKRPPADGAPTPQTPGFMSMYRDGIGTQPIGVAEFQLLKKRHGVYGEVRNRPIRDASMILMFGSLASVQALPGGGMSVGPAFVAMFEPWALLPPRDLGPPALPILMVRVTRQAVADNPLDAQSRFCLDEAEQIRQAQEDQWAGAFGPGRLRERVVQIQHVTNLYALAQLQPDNAEHHLRLAKVYARENLLDLALEHMQAAEKALEARKPANKEEQKAIEAFLKAHREDVQELDKAVRLRVSKWKELCSKLAAERPAGKLSSAEVALEKALLAYQGKYQEVVGKHVVGNQFGLGKKAFELLTEIDPEKLPDDTLRLVDLQMRYGILLAMGRADLVMQSLRNENIRKSLPAEFHAQNALFAGAALGDYEATEEALAAIEKNFREQAKSSGDTIALALGKYAPAFLVMPQIGSASALASAATLQAVKPLIEINSMRASQDSQVKELCNVITLRGIVALEAGNTGHARALFQRALDEAGDLNYFTERPIARRYLDLLNEQKR